MNVSLTDLRGLDAGKSYYIANSTGGIKEAGVWQRFKCALNIGDGREKAAKLVEAARTAMLDAAGMKSDAGLDASLKGLDTDSSISGRALGAIAEEFSRTNAKAIASATARGLARIHIGEAMRSLVRSGVVDDVHKFTVKSIMEDAVKSVLENPPLLGSGALDNARFVNFVESRISTLAGIMRDMSAKKMPLPDKTFGRHIIERCFDENGEPNGKGVNDLDVRSDIIEAAALENASHIVRHHGKDQALELIRPALEDCGDDPDVLDCVLNSLDAILVRGDGQIRSADSVKEKVAGIKANIEEARAAAKDNSQMYSRLLALIKALSPGKAMEKGSIRKFVDIIDKAPMPALATAKKPVRTAELHAMMREVRNLEIECLKETGLFNQYEGGDAHGAMSGTFWRVLCDKMGKSGMRNAQRLLESGESAYLMKVYNAISQSNGMSKKGLTAEQVESYQMDALTTYMSLGELKGNLDHLLGDKYVGPDAAKIPEELFDDGESAVVLEDFLVKAGVPREVIDANMG